MGEEARTICNRLVGRDLVEVYIEETGEVIERIDLSAPTPPSPGEQGGWLTDPERIAEIERTFAGRTKYVGRRIPWDELLLAEAHAQRARADKAERESAQHFADWRIANDFIANAQEAQRAAESLAAEYRAVAEEAVGVRIDCTNPEDAIRRLRDLAARLAKLTEGR